MCESRPAVVFLDVMNTLVYDPIEDEIPAFFGLSLDQLYARKHPTAWAKFERGAISESTFYDIYLPDRFEPIDGESLRATLYDAYHLIDGIESVLERLHAGSAALYALSNYPVWYRIIDDKLDLSRFLRWDFVSCKTGRRKPDPSAYLEAADAVGRPPGDCLFVDDRLTNCEAARETGMDAIVFETADQLGAELSRRGL